jgi:regulator of replication initiation timing
MEYETELKQSIDELREEVKMLRTEIETLKVYLENPDTKNIGIGNNHNVMRLIKYGGI